MESVLTWVTRIVLFVPYVAMLLFDELTGQARWYRRKARELSERKPLTDAMLRQRLTGTAWQREIWLAVRETMAKLIGVEKEYLYPEDPFKDLWNMQWGVPDMIGVVVHLESRFGCQIANEHIRDNAFGQQFAAVATLSEFCELLIPIVTNATQPKSPGG